MIVGIDVSKASLDVAWLEADLVVERHPNTAVGRTALLARVQAARPTLLALEATGAYHLPLLASLLAAQVPVAVINPARIAAFRQVTGRRNKTDRQDAVLIARYAAVHADEVQRAQAVTPAQQQLRALVGYREQLLTEKTRLTSQHEAASWAAQTEILPLLAARQTLVAEQLADIEARLAAVLATIPEAAVLLALPGIGPITVATVLAYLPVGIWGEVKAAAAYAGVHPRQVQSGTRQHSQLSKAGPAPLRRVLYMAALAALQWDAAMRTRYERLLAAGKLPLVALGALMHAVLRKLMGVLRRYYQEHPTRQATAAA